MNFGIQQGSRASTPASMSGPIGHTPKVPIRVYCVPRRPQGARSGHPCGTRLCLAISVLRTPWRSFAVQNPANNRPLRPDPTHATLRVFAASREPHPIGAPQALHTPSMLSVHSVVN